MIGGLWTRENEVQNVEDMKSRRGRDGGWSAFCTVANGAVFERRKVG